MARPKTYNIKLSADERAALQKTICNKKTCKTILKRCQILLELDEKQPLSYPDLSTCPIYLMQIDHTFNLFPNN